MKKKKPKIQKKKLPGFWKLVASTWNDLTTFWRPIFGVTAVYGVLYFILVLGLSVSYSYSDVTASVAESLGENAGWLATQSAIIFSLFTGSSASNQSDATVMVQFLLFIVATLAIIWTLRRLQSLKHIRFRDAYYSGNAQIVPFLLVSVILLLTLIPAIIGSTIFGVAFSAGAIGIELVIVSIVTGLTLFLSLYWLVAWLPALYIVSLPGGTPIKSIKASAGLTKKHRFWFLRNIAGLAILILFAMFAAMLPIVLAVPVIAIGAVFVVSFIAFACVQTFLYRLYRSLLDE